MTHVPGEPAPDPKVVLCQLTQGDMAEPPQDEGIPIATVEFMEGQHLGAVEQCGVRTRIYSQATLLEIISYLVTKSDLRPSETKLSPRLTTTHPRPPTSGPIAQR